MNLEREMKLGKPRAQGSCEPLRPGLTGRQRVKAVVLAVAAASTVAALTVAVLRNPPTIRFVRSDAVLDPIGPESKHLDRTTFKALKAAHSLNYYVDPILQQTPQDNEDADVNVEGRVRNSYVPVDAATTVWFFGGSTMFGMGQRDERTIASELARLAESDGILIEPVNFGVPAYTNWVETEVLAQQLTVRQPPDLAVFYDRANEFGTAIDMRSLGAHLQGRIARTIISRFSDDDIANLYGDAVKVSNELMVDQAADQYRRGVTLAGALASSYGFEVVHFWQPQLSSKRLGPHDDRPVDFFGRELDFDNTLSDEARRDRALEVLADNHASYDQMRIRSGVDPIDISDALDEATGPTYFDLTHTNEYGALLAAEAIYKHLRPILVDLTERR